MSSLAKTLSLRIIAIVLLSTLTVGCGGGFFASALGESGKTINLYIYPLVTYDAAAVPSVEITNAQLDEASEELLAAAAPML